MFNKARKMIFSTFNESRMIKKDWPFEEVALSTFLVSLCVSLLGTKVGNYHSFSVPVPKSTISGFLPQDMYISNW